MHIGVLERARLVRRRRAGREHLLSFNPEPLDEAATWIEAQCATLHPDWADYASRAEAAWAKMLDALAETLSES